MTKNKKVANAYGKSILGDNGDDPNGEMCKSLFDGLNPDKLYDKITKEIKKKTEKEILKFIDDIYEYTLNSKKGNSYVVDASIINQLGVFIGNLESNNAKEKEFQFYSLAEERDDHWGARNKAKCLLYGEGAKKSVEKALESIKKAIELTSNTDDKHKHKLLYAEILIAQSKMDHLKAALNINEYLVKVCKEGSEENSLDLVKKIFYHISDNKLENKTDALEKSVEIVNLLISKFMLPEPKLSRAYLIKGQLHQFLGEYKEAWQAYCSPVFKETKKPIIDICIQFRVELLKDFIEKKLEDKEMDQMALGDLSINDSKPKNPATPNGIPFPFKFNTFWYKEANWFASLDKESLVEEYNQQEKQIQLMIDSKSKEINLIKEAIYLKDSDQSEFEKKKLSLTKEKDYLEKIQQDIEEIYQQYTAKDRAILRRHKAEQLFFNPKRIGSKKKNNKDAKKKKLIKLTYNIIDGRYGIKTDPIDLSGKSTRMVMMAERLFQEAVITLSADPNSPTLGIPIKRTQPYSPGYGNGSNDFGAKEVYRIGDIETQLQHRVNPKRERMGTLFISDFGNYTDDVYGFFRKLTGGNEDKEKKIAEWMIDYGKTYQAFSLEKLKEIYHNAQIVDVNKFNTVCFLIMGKEQSQWLSAIKQKNQIGMSISLARSLIMIKEGFLKLEDAFKNNAFLSIYSYKGIERGINNIIQSCSHIDALYMEYLKAKNTENRTDYMQFFRSQLKKPRTAVLTREQAHQDLLACYGGEDESDGDIYESDIEF
ncbi:hypothetical protein ACTFIZ_000935 [Dictyostelium cf. discoideum]